MYFKNCYINFIFLCLFLKISHQQNDRPIKNSPHIIYKKLSPVELNENIPIGYLIIDLKANLIDHENKNLNTNFHYQFEFIDEFDNKHYSSNYHHHLQSSHHLPFSSQSSIKQYFLLDIYSGTIHTSKSIDLENFCDLNLCKNRQKYDELNQDLTNNGLKESCLIPFKVKAFRQVLPNKTSNHKNYYTDQVYHISFDFLIRDVNEFKPEFINHKEVLFFNISEEFYPIKLPIGSVAFDNDCTDRGSLIYTIKILKINSIQLDDYLKKFNTTNSNIFDFKIIIDQDLLFLYSNRPFDREIHQNVELEIIASDRQNLKEANTASLKVFIQITDINDNAPKFEKQIYYLEFDEGLEPGTELLKLNASDPDQGPNGEVKYEFAILNDEIKETFYVNPNTAALVLKKKLDYDRKKMWQLSIRASDQSLNSNVKSSIALVNLRVNDVNNNKPEINLNIFSISGKIEARQLTRRDVDNDITVKEDIIYLSKSIPVNTTIGIVFIRDQDSGLNGFIESCDISLKDTNDLTSEIPVYLQDFNSLIDNMNKIDDSSIKFSTDIKLNNLIESIIETDYKINKQPIKLTNEKKYLLRLGSDLNRLFIDSNKKILNFSLIIKSSDKGVRNKQTGLNEFKLFIINSNSNSFKDLSQFLDEDEIDYDNDYLPIYDNFEDLEDYEEDMNQYLNGRSSYRIDLKENNQYPIELIRFNTFDFDLNSPVKYELFLTTAPIKEQQNSQNSSKLSKLIQKRIKLIKCSYELHKYLNIDPYNGIIVLNKSLDTHKCTNYKYFIRATDLIEKRLSSLLVIKINVLNEKGSVKFERNHFRFDIIENVFNTSFNIKLSDQSNENMKKLNFKLESIMNEVNQTELDSHFSIIKNLNDKSVDLLVHNGLDYEYRSKYKFNLVIELNNRTNIDKALIEINVLDENEKMNSDFRKVSIIGELTSKKSVNFTKLSNQDYLVFINFDHLMAKLQFKETINTKAYFSLIKFEQETYGTKSGFVYTIVGMKFYDNFENLKRNNFYSFPSNFDSTKLFLLNDLDGVLNIDLSNFNQITSRIKSSILLCFLKISIIENNLTTTKLIRTTSVNLFLIIHRNHTSSIVLNEIYHETNAKFESIFKIISNNLNLKKSNDSNSNGKHMLKENLKKIRKVLFSSNHFPILILTILIFILIITLIVLFIVSILYSISICRFFKCNLNKENSNNTNNNNDSKDSSSKESQNEDISPFNSLLKKTQPQKEFKQGRFKFTITKIFSSKKQNDLICSNMCKDKTRSKGSKFITNQNEKNPKEYLFDSPILIRKMYENADSESQKQYLKKHNMEYLLEEKTPESSLKKSLQNGQKKKIKFNCNEVSKSEESNDNLKQNPILQDILIDDDLILPVKNYNFITQSKMAYFNQPDFMNVKLNYQEPNDFNLETINNTIYNQFNLSNSNTLSYKKSPIQPENNIWVKKFNSNSGYMSGVKLNDSEILL